MILFKKTSDLSDYLALQRAAELKIGFVPTMGALHKGHLALVNHSKKNTNITIASIFVNPTQFNDPQDFAKYPVTLESDLLQLEQAGCDLVFLPAVNEIYPEGLTISKTYDLGYLETILEGKYRPGHFQGVCQVVDKLLDIVAPTLLFLGQKDYQQCMVIRKLIELKGISTTLSIVPTIRETSGLALSSRNLRLSEKGKEAAVGIYQSLIYLKQNRQKYPAKQLIEEVEKKLLLAGFTKTDYVAIANANTLDPVMEWDGDTPLVALIAAFMDGVRLIDNMQLT
ncbi:MAG: pantoate--beta-alanine ligase [Bacteroidota bacterium]